MHETCYRQRCTGPVVADVVLIAAGKTRPELVAPVCRPHAKNERAKGATVRLRKD